MILGFKGVYVNGGGSFMVIVLDRFFMVYLVV